MRRSRAEFGLFPQQIAALDHPSPELLVGGDDRGTGRSHFLRVLAIVLASRHRGLRVWLLRKIESDLRRTHFEGPANLFAMLSGMQEHGGCEIFASEIRLANGSSIRWSACNRETEISAVLEQGLDVALIDDVDEISEPSYVRIREGAMNSTGPAHRVVATTGRLSAIAWASRRFVDPGSPACAYVPMRAADIDPEVSRPRAPETLREFVEKVRPGFVWRRHTIVIANAMQRLVDHEIENLAIFIPPQHGKTELAARLGAAYRLSRFPSEWIGLTSYNARTAESRSFDARDFYQRSGREIEPGAGGIGLWRSRLGGGVWAAGIDGGQTGNPMSFGIIDDPDKSYMDAVSPAESRKKRAWFGPVWLARESMFASLSLSQLLIATRWDQEDTAGFILKQLVMAGRRVHVVVLPALYDPEIAAQFTDPASCRIVYGEDAVEPMQRLLTVEPDWRTEPGEPIDPDRRPADEWNSMRVALGELTFSTTWQQNPMPAASGGIFDRKWFEISYETPPKPSAFRRLCRAWDDAASSEEDGGGSDATASALVGILPGPKSETGKELPGRLVLLSVTEDRVDGSEVKAHKVALAIEDGPRVRVKIPQDPGAAGKTDAKATEQALKPHANKVIVHRPTGSKKVRARDASSMARPVPPAEHGRFLIYANADGLVGRVELRRVLDVLHRFTGVEGGDDDIVDAFVDAVNEVALPGNRFSIG